MKFIVAYIIFFGVGACNIKQQNNEEGRLQIKKDTIQNPKFEKILFGLSKNYIHNFSNFNKHDLLNFYQKTPGEYLVDSITYQQSVLAFFSSDSTILDYLLQFKGDKSFCRWIYSPNPFKSSVNNWELKFSKEQGSTVLIYDYLLYNGIMGASITVNTSQIESIITKLKIQEIDSLIKSKRGKTLKELSQEFKRYIVEQNIY